MKNFFLLSALIFILNSFAQDNASYEKWPVFSACETLEIQEHEPCFNQQLTQFIFENFEVPEIVAKDNYKGNVVVLFEVDEKGNFVVLYVDAIYEELKTKTKLVFAELPKIKPATYNGNPTYKQFSIEIKIPLEEPNSNTEVVEKENEISEIEKLAKTEYDSINANAKVYDNDAFKSPLNIPFTHQYYSRFDRNMNLVGTNSHTATKPYLYNEVSKYYDFEENHNKLVKKTDSWWLRKLFNENLVRVKGKDYWFTLDFVFDVQAGKDTDADFSSTFNNTRGIYVQGGLGKKLTFSTSVFESQGRFAQYYNQFAESLGRPGSENDIAIVPGRGIAKRFKEDAYDYPVAEAWLTFAAAKFLDIQFGHGKNFIGDGYRSLLQSDVASPSAFLKLNTKFWKIKYTNTWMWLKDVRPEVEEDGAYLTKYMANHYLSWNVSKRFNLGLFESVMWVNSNNRGFDINYLNPIIFYRAIEFETGQEAGNAVLGASAKYKWNDNINLYGQFILDEFSLGDIKGGDKSWKNKYGYQLGIKYYNAFKVDNLMLQLEYNRVRPYTYSHDSITLNYGHNNQPMAHLWGANFSEAILIGHYNYRRWFADAKFIYGVRGLDFNTTEDNFNYGGDIYRNYEEDRPFDTGVEVGQGNKTNVFHAELQGGYLLNPATNLKLFGYLSFRNFNPNANTVSTFKSDTVWFSLGLKTDLFNWYFDF